MLKQDQIDFLAAIGTAAQNFEEKNVGDEWWSKFVALYWSISKVQAL